MNGNLIQQVSHEPRKPVEIERLHNDALLIEGVLYAGDFFRSMADPNPNYLYAIRREGDRVILTTIRNVADATGFFFTQEYGQKSPSKNVEIDNAI
jgi:hypothetical protein